MANEAQINSSLVIRKSNLYYQSQPAAFTATVNAVGGPTPGTITVTTAGTDLDLSALTTPGLCRVMNLDGTNYVQLGVWNPDQSEFYPVMRIKPGESFVFRLDPDVNEEYSGAGTGITGELNTLRLKAANASAKVLVEAFED